MKWTIQELRKLSYTNNQFEYLCDCKKFLTDDILDVVDISNVRVKGRFNFIEANRLYVFELLVHANLTMLCALTLEEVDVEIEFETSLEFSKVIIDDNTLLIEKMTIDLDPYIFGEILIEKPMKVVGKNAYDTYNEEIVTLDEEEVASKNPFSKLKDS